MKSKKDMVIDTALALFSKHGYHVVGVDRIKDEAGVSKMTMYKYFPTKEVLIENVLTRRDELFQAGLARVIDNAEYGCLAKIKAIFDWHRQWFQRDDFYGCMFIKASEEFPDRASKICRISRDHKLHIKHLMQQILKDGKVIDSDALSDHLLVVLEGLIVNTNMFSDVQCVDVVWPYVAEILASRNLTGEIDS